MDIGKLTAVNQSLPTKRPCKIGDDWLIVKLYKLSARDFAMKLIRDVRQTTGITATAGIGANMYL